MEGVPIDSEELRQLLALAWAVENATWDEGVGGHAIVGSRSWERIQNALEKLKKAQQATAERATESKT